jgi:hypothetical protein
MASEHLRRLWREAQQRRREKLARLGITGRRKAHKPAIDHPWVKDRDGFGARDRGENEFEEQQDEGRALSLEILRRELGF